MLMDMCLQTPWSTWYALPVWRNSWTRLQRWFIHYKSTPQCTTESRPCNIRGICWPCQSIWHGQSRSTITHPWTLWSPTKTCRCNSNDLHQQHLCAQDRKRNSRDPPECRCTPRWQYGSGSIPLPHEGICRNSWNSLEAARNPSCQCHDSHRREHDQWKNMQPHSDHVQIVKSDCVWNSTMFIRRRWCIPVWHTRWSTKRNELDISPLWQVRNGNAHRTRNIDV